MKTTFGLVFCVAIGLFVAAPQSKGSTSFCDSVAGNLVSNCGFEAGTPGTEGEFIGWLLTGADVPGEQDNLYGVENVDPLDGISPNSGDNQAFFADSDATPTTLIQTLTTVAGQIYAISVFLAQDTTPTPAVSCGGVPCTNVFSISFDGNSLVSTTGVPKQPYTMQTYLAIASSTSTTFSITVGNSAGETLLDDVSVEGVPEPSSLSMIGAGILGLGFAAFRCRQKTA